MLDKDDAVAPSIDEVRVLARKLDEWVVRTPVVRSRNLEIGIDTGAELWGKLEFLQQTGTFKPRGALSNLLDTDPDELTAGVTTVSAGNHAIATAFAACCVGVHAKVVMMRAASPARIEACRHYGAEIVLADDVHQAFDLVEEIRDKEGRCFIHPFEGRNVTAGTATIGLEICEQIESFDAVVIPIGGGGLCSGIASAIKQLKPGVEVIGVEPAGADSMRQSFASGKAEKLDTLDTIADSLGAPFALPYSFEICRQYVDELVTVSDAELKESMAMLFGDMKIAVEPACAASTAAIAGPLNGRFDGRKVVLIFCGSNIDWRTFEGHVGPF
ncbi:MAG: threonine/serine dehydratase [Woeseiaceae bacterium]|nr:threonine/serine dehydratase [Woeseiaceae bacterium]